ncbi:recombination mediator RecR [Govanella unica]|uniref:Recombination protein RecR n=1 Tax=Govanella unica TaxID=2975056 RepID=A0A9X3TWD9_9PROT|nr:recombination mediator RecR [Govania unica]MDA5192955.1 recombination mediator RecR [Govania unica]
MTDHQQQNDIEALAKLLAKLPGLGPRSARRAVLHLLKKKESLMLPLATALSETAERVGPCAICGNLDSLSPCRICSDARRDKTIICVVEDVSDLWALERAGAFRGQYHVLGGTLSALEGIGPDNLNIRGLIDRVDGGGIREVILATNATVDGQTTAHYLMDKLGRFDLTVSQLAHGVPVGGELDYLDEGTLLAALKSRRPF